MNCEHLIFMRDNLDLSQREMAENLMFQNLLTLDGKLVKTLFRSSI